MWLLLSAVSLAADDPHAAGAPADEHAPAAHGAAEGDHGAEAAHAAEGDHGGAHHVTYTGDDDHDGIPNWRDPAQGSEENKESYVVTKLAWHTFSLTVLVALIVWAVRKPMLDTFRDRALGVRKELTDAARRREEAQRRHQDLITRLERIEHEVADMEKQAEVEAQREEEKLVERARREGARIAEQAERNIRDEVQRARNTLRTEAVELAVRLAEATLRNQVSAADQQILAREFLASMKNGGDVG
jgi:F0F1-type ATP synthase membrane subunit b/b'